MLRVSFSSAERFSVMSSRIAEPVTFDTQREVSSDRYQ